MSRKREDHRRKVGLWIRIRRRDLGLTQAELAEAAGIRSVKTLTNAEAGHSELTQRAADVETVLGWERGSLTRAYHLGEEPVPVDVLDAPARPGETAERLRTITVTEEQYEALMALWEQLDRQYPPRRRNDEDEDRLA